MYKIAKYSVFLFSISIITGCTGLDYPKAEVAKVNDEFTSISYTADLRAVHVIKKGDAYWVLAEPTPDAAFSYDDDEELNIDLSLVSTGDKSDGGESTSTGSDDLPLTGRASYVLFARELSYRMNEMALNLNLSPEQYMEMYKASMATIEKVALIEAAQITTTNNTTVTTGSTASLSRTDAHEYKVDATNTDSRTESDQTTDSTTDTKDESSSSTPTQ